MHSVEMVFWILNFDLFQSIMICSAVFPGDAGQYGGSESQLNQSCDLEA